MVRHRKTEAGCRSYGLLVAEPGRFSVVAELRVVQTARFRLYLRLCLYLDSIYPEPHHPLPPQASSPELSGLRRFMSARVEVLQCVRTTVERRGERGQSIDRIELRSGGHPQPASDPVVAAGIEFSISSEQ